jgi:hypothetical protein
MLLRKMIYGVYVSFIGGENGGQVVIPTAHYSDGKKGE